ncbi:hypothetical protein ABT160_23460 [Streptomyces sp. NPDC001941]
MISTLAAVATLVPALEIIRRVLERERKIKSIEKPPPVKDQEGGPDAP